MLPTIKVDADSRNIEQLHVEADPLRFKPTRTPEQMAALQAGGFSFSRNSYIHVASRVKF